MRMVSITEIRRNAKAVLSDLAKTKKPIAILQSSKPIAYLVDAESFKKLHFESNLIETRTKSLEKILQLNKQVNHKTTNRNSVELIRELREGNNRNE